MYFYCICLITTTTFDIVHISSFSYRYYYYYYYYYHYYIPLVYIYAVYSWYFWFVNTLCRAILSYRSIKLTFVIQFSIIILRLISNKQFSSQFFPFSQYYSYRYCVKKYNCQALFLYMTGLLAYTLYSVVTSEKILFFKPYTITRAHQEDRKNTRRTQLGKTFVSLKFVQIIIIPAPSFAKFWHFLSALLLRLSATSSQFLAFSVHSHPGPTWRIWRWLL